MHIFISYAKADTRDLALKLREAFIALTNVTAWMDNSLHSGEDWATQIQDEIDRADLVVVLLSEDVNRPANHPNGRSFVLKEIHYAQQSKKTILPIMARRTRIPVQLAGIEYIDFTKDSTSAFQRLINEIANRAGISVVNPVEPIQPKLYRRPIIIVGIVVFTIIALAVTLIPSLNTPPKVTGTGVGVGIVPSNTYAAVIISSSDTPSVTSSPVATSSPTSTDNMTSIALGFPGNPVTKNTDWKPQYQTFDGVEMALVPVGCFMMGNNNGENDEKPVTRQCNTEPFWIDRTEVTNKEYGSAGYFKGDNYPRDSVTWTQARDFCVKRGANVRLPTELEWEYSARGPDSFVYPWGNGFLADNVVYTNNSNRHSAQVGSKPSGVSWVGALDMSGNLWEWVNSIYKPYPYNFGDDREINSDSPDIIHVFRGGAWSRTEYMVRASNRGIVDISYSTDSNIGFRCAHSQ